MDKLMKLATKVQNTKREPDIKDKYYGHTWTFYV